MKGTFTLGFSDSLKIYLAAVRNYNSRVNHLLAADLHDEDCGRRVLVQSISQHNATDSSCSRRLNLALLRALELHVTYYQ